MKWEIAILWNRELPWRMSDSWNRATSHCTFCESA